MRHRHRIQPYLSHELYKQLRHYTAKAVCTETAVVEAALKDYFDREASHATQIMRRLDRLVVASRRKDHTLDAIGEMLALFVKLWFVHTPRLPEAQRTPAEQAAMPRYVEFARYVRNTMTTPNKWSAEMGIDDASPATTTPTEPATGTPD